MKPDIPNPSDELIRAMNPREGDKIVRGERTIEILSVSDGVVRHQLKINNDCFSEMATTLDEWPRSVVKTLEIDGTQFLPVESQKRTR